MNGYDNPYDTVGYESGSAGGPVVVKTPCTTSTLQSAFFTAGIGYYDPSGRRFPAIEKRILFICLFGS